MNDMSVAIIPRSDQINAEDFLSGPRTFVIERVEITPGSEQPVAIKLEGEPRVWKSCKSMSRCLVAAWGPDASVYAGRSVTLYRDATVKWGGMAVGGIRISNMSHIDRDMVLALTETKGKKKIHTVRPLAAHAKTEPKTEAPKPSETKRRTWADVLPEIETELNACTTEDQVQDIANRPMIKAGLEKPETTTAKNLNAMIKAALDRVAEPVDGDEPTHDGEPMDEAAA
jgi:hypothetical protein